MLHALALVGMVSLPGLFPSSDAPASGGTFAAVRSARPSPRNETRVRVVVAFAPAAALHAAVRAQSDPTSPMFRRFISPAAARTTFSPSSSTYAHAESVLVRSGFTIEETSASRMTLTASAPGPVVAAFFRATPGSLGASQIIGLERVRERARPPHPAMLASAVPPQPNVYGKPFFGPDGGFGPALPARIDDYPSLHRIPHYGTIFNGFGTTIAEVIAASAGSTQLEPFYQEFGITPRNSVRNVWSENCFTTGSCVYSDFPTGFMDEEWMTALAPGANIDYYSLGGTFSTDLLTGLQAAIDGNPDVIDMPYEFQCEVENAPFAQAVENLFDYASALGESIVTSQDYGAGPCTAHSSYPRAVGVPYDSPDVLAVTGSKITTDGAGNIASLHTFDFSTGGVSPIFTTPTYQVGVPHVSKRGRTLPDFVSPAEIDGVGPSVFTAGFYDPNGTYWAPGWGTFTRAIPFARTAPIAALVAEWVQMHQGRLGRVDATLYPLAQTPGSTAFHDVTDGCVRWYHSPADPPPPICAGTGYDEASGLGEVDGWAVGSAIKL